MATDGARPRRGAAHRRSGPCGLALQVLRCGGRPLRASPLLCACALVRALNSAGDRSEKTRDGWESGRTRMGASCFSFSTPRCIKSLIYAFSPCEAPFARAIVMTAWAASGLDGEQAMAAENLV